MAYLSLYRRHRPQTFEEILGQEHVARTLANAITEDRVAHAYLFTGPRGTGKTSTARILAKALNCEKGPTPTPCGKCHSCVSIADGSSLDVIEMDAASHSKVDETREILAGVPLATAGGRRKVYVIDEVHMLSTQAFNALLKTLEEPPPHVLFILATTEAHKVLPTIVSRTQRFDFRRVPTDIIESHLAAVAKSEQIDVDESGLAAIARHADGSVRDALSILDQLSSFGGRASVSDVERILGERGEDAYISLFDAIIAGDVGTIFSILGSLIAEGADIRQLTEGALGHARALLLLATSPGADELLDIADQDRPRLAEQAQRFAPAALLRTVDLIWKSYVEMRNAPNHRLLLEVALVRAAAPDTDPSAGGLLGRIERLERRLGIEEQPETEGEPSRRAAPAQQAPVPAAERSAPATERPPPAPAPESPAARPSAEPPPPGQPAATPPGQPAPESPAARPSAEPPPPGQPAAIPPGQPAATPPGQPAATPPGQPAATPPGQPAATPPGQPAAVPPEVGLGHVKDAWSATLQEVKGRSKTVWALLAGSVPHDFEGDALVVEVTSDFHEGEMAQERNRAVLADSLHAALGIRPRLAFAARKKDAPPQATVSQEVPEYEDTEQPAHHDPVELLKKGLGAEVVEERAER